MEFHIGFRECRLGRRIGLMYIAGLNVERLPNMEMCPHESLDHKPPKP